MWVYKPGDLTIVEVNEAATRLYGYSRKEMTSLTLKDLCPDLPEQNTGIRKHHTSNNEVVYVRIASYPVEWDKEACKLVVACDVTGEVQAEKELKQRRNTTKQKQICDTQRRYDMIVKATKDAIYDWCIISDNLYWNESFRSCFGHDPEKGNNTIEGWTKHIHPEDEDRTVESMLEALNTPTVFEWEAEYRFAKSDGSYANVLERGCITRDETGQATRMVGALEDITQRKRAEKQLRESLKEKEVLLAEIHHRVKNNLAVVSGMMQLQIFEEENEELRNKLWDGVSRIQSMAIIHEHLYQSGSFSKLEFADNLKQLVLAAVDTIQVDVKINKEFNLESIQLNVNQAIPASLIVNEVVTNILKHAFKGMDKGNIAVELAQIDQQIILKIIDNGVGLPKDFNTGTSKKLGLQLIDELSKQLKGNYVYESPGEGSIFKLQFQKSEVKGTGSAHLQ